VDFGLFGLYPLLGYVISLDFFHRNIKAQQRMVLRQYGIEHNAEGLFLDNNWFFFLELSSLPLFIELFDNHYMYFMVLRQRKDWERKK